MDGITGGVDGTAASIVDRGFLLFVDLSLFLFLFSSVSSPSDPPSASSRGAIKGERSLVVLAFSPRGTNR